MTGRVPALLATHADLAAALLRAAEKVEGPIDGVEVMTNEGLSKDGLEREIERRVCAWTQGGLVLTDFWGGSPHMCGAKMVREREVVIVTGLNLPMLLDYLHNREKFGVVELAERLKQKGQDGIRIQRRTPA